MRRNTPLVNVYYQNAPSEYKPDEIIDRAAAMWMNRGKGIRLFGKFRMRMPSTGMPTDYAPAYDRMGLEKYPREVVGGLVRIETRPAPITILTYFKR